MYGSGDDNLDVIVIDEPQADTLRSPRSLPRAIPPKHSRFVVPRQAGRWSVCALLSVALHSLLVGSMLLGTASRKSTPPNEGAAASAQQNASEFVSTLVILNNHSITSSTQERDDSAYTASQAIEKLTKSEVIFVTSESIPTPELDMSGSDSGTDANSPTVAATGDDAGRAMLFGRYMNQVKARIERAWVHPTTTMRQNFQCKVLIKQNSHGEVQEVTLQRCDVDVAWQLSLVQAIQTASPLPAPPNETLFTEALTLSFDADITPSYAARNDH